MKVPGALLTVGFIAFLVGWRGPFHATPSAIALYTAIALSVTGVLWGLIRGPRLVRVSIGLYLISAAWFLIGLILVRPSTGGPGVRPPVDIGNPWATLSLLFLVLSVLTGLMALRAETTTTSGATTGGTA